MDTSWFSSGDEQTEAYDAALALLRGLPDMGWAERLKKNKIPCGACGNERPCPHWHQDAGRMCDSCYRKLAATLNRLAGQPAAAPHFKSTEYEYVGWLYDGSNTW